MLRRTAHPRPARLRARGRVRAAGRRGRPAPPAADPLAEGRRATSRRPTAARSRRSAGSSIHVTEGSFWGSVRWLRNEHAHASSHFVVSRSGRIVQLVHLSDIAWHAGNWRMNVGRSASSTRAGRTTRPGSRRRSTRPRRGSTAYLARRALLPIDRAHVIGHARGARATRRAAAAPATTPTRGRTGTGTDYLRLVRRYASAPGEAARRAEVRLAGRCAGSVPWRAATAGGVRRVEFVVDGRVLVGRPARAVLVRGGRGLNTTWRSANGRHVLELRAYGDGTRHDVTRRPVVVRNRGVRH